MIVSNSRTATVVTKTATAELAVSPGLKWHQIDCGVAATGSLAVNVDFGSGKRTIKTIDLTASDRVPVLVFGDAKSIELVPTDVGVDYSVAYIATEV